MADDDNDLFADFKYFRYNPSTAGNIVFVVLFAIPAVAHAYMLVKRRTWYFVPFLVGCLFEAIGYIGRVICAQESPDWTLSPYIMQSLLILLGPALYAASIYMVLGRLIRLLDAHHHSLVRTKWLTKLFVTGDVLSFLTQGAGGGVLATAKSIEARDRGENLVLGGLAIQVVFFGFFIITTIIFDMRIRKDPTTRVFSIAVPWRQLIMMLYLSSALIMVRSIFRMIEYGMGNDSILMRHEGYLFGFDGALIFLVTVAFLWFHPGTILEGYKEMGVSEDVESSRDGYPMADQDASTMYLNQTGPDKVQR